SRADRRSRESADLPRSSPQDSPALMLESGAALVLALGPFLRVEAATGFPVPAAGALVVASGAVLALAGGLRSAEGRGSGDVSRLGLPLALGLALVAAGSGAPLAAVAIGGTASAVALLLGRPASGTDRRTGDASPAPAEPRSLRALLVAASAGLPPLGLWAALAWSGSSALDRATGERSGTIVLLSTVVALFGAMAGHALFVVAILRAERKRAGAIGAQRTGVESPATRAGEPGLPERLAAENEADQAAPNEAGRGGRGAEPEVEPEVARDGDVELEADAEADGEDPLERGLEGPSQAPPSSPDEPHPGFAPFPAVRVANAPARARTSLLAHPKLHAARGRERARVPALAAKPRTLASDSPGKGSWHRVVDATLALAAIAGGLVLLPFWLASSTSAAAIAGGLIATLASALPWTMVAARRRGSRPSFSHLARLSVRGLAAARTLAFALPFAPAVVARIGADVAWFIVDDVLLRTFSQALARAGASSARRGAERLAGSSER